MKDAGTITIGERLVGNGAPAFVVAEVGQAHEGSLGHAFSFIDAVAESGADAVKFQTHIARAESSLDEKFRIPMSGQDESRYAYWERMEFSEGQWKKLAAHARSRGLVFLSSSFSLEAVEILKRIGMPAWKVGSGEFRSRELVAAMAETGAPVLLGTGMSTYREIEEMVSMVRGHGSPVGILQCTSEYPTPFEHTGLNVIDELRRRFSAPVGLSDHSGSIFPSLGALARGADIIEVHVTFDRRLYGPDAQASLTFDELELVVQGRDAFREMDSHPVDKDEAAVRLKAMREQFSRSLAPKEPLSTGTVLEGRMLTTKKPGSGIAPEMKDKVVGRRLKRSVTPERLLCWEDLDDE